jgi:hypothetical protein
MYMCIFIHIALKIWTMFLPPYRTIGFSIIEYEDSENYRAIVGCKPWCQNIDLSTSIHEKSNNCQALIFVNWPEPTIRPMKKGLVTVRPARLSCRSTWRVSVLKGLGHEILLYCTSRQAVLVTVSLYQDLSSLKLCTKLSTETKI